MDFPNLLEQMVRKNASDLFISVGATPKLKIEGKLNSVGKQKLTSALARELVYSVLDDEQIKTFESTSELNIALRIKDFGRFRINVFRQMGDVALVARYIKGEIPSIEALGLPNILSDLIMEPRGLVLLVGGTGTGKSTTLASMIDYRNTNLSGHILCIEDPVEFVHEHKKSLVNQREVGLDTASYSIALKNTMREAPDVIMIGEIRDRETMKSAIAYAETGHLCVSTLHANNANQAIDRIINFFPEDAHSQLLLDLSLNLRAIVSQRLTMGNSGKRVAAVEVMLSTPYIADLIAKGEIAKIKDAMVQAKELGCQTFDNALFELVQEGQIAQEEALKNADSVNNLALRFRLEGTGIKTHEQVKKDVSYAKFIDFEQYSSYRIKRVKVPEKYIDRMELFEGSLRKVLLNKELKEDTQTPDLEIQYMFKTNSTKEVVLDNIEDAISSDININLEREKNGVIKIVIVDIHLKKSIWQVVASRKLATKIRPQSEVDKDISNLFDEFPPG